MVVAATKWHNNRQSADLPRIPETFLIPPGIRAIFVKCGISAEAVEASTFVQMDCTDVVLPDFQAQARAAACMRRAFDRRKECLAEATPARFVHNGDRVQARDVTVAAEECHCFADQTR